MKGNDKLIPALTGLPADELTAVAGYGNVTKPAADLGDNATKDILEGILQDGGLHVNEFEEKLDQIKQMGAQLLLAIQADASLFAKSRPHCPVENKGEHYDTIR